MQSRFYEDRIPIKPFKLEFYNEDIFGLEARNIQINQMNNSILFLHIKSLYVGDMRIPYELPDNNTSPRLCFVEYEVKNGQYVGTIKEVRRTEIFVRGTSSSSLDRFVRVLNDNIDDYVAECKRNDNDDTKVKGRYLYGHFTIENNKLQFNYKFERETGEPFKIAVLGFNKPFLDIIVKYFDVRGIYDNIYHMFYIRPSFHERDIENDFRNVPNERIVTAFKDTTDFFFPTHTLTIEISNSLNPKFTATDVGFCSNTISYNCAKSCIEMDKYILLADKESSALPVSYRIYADVAQDGDASITGEAEYIVLKDMFDQFNMFRLQVGYIYSGEEYRELSYKKLMGLTANTVYLQNASSTELLEKLLARLEQHYPDIGGNRDISLWQSIRDLVGDKETLEEIYKLLYHAYPQEPYGPQSKKIKIDF